jgi:hypothetical protein
MGRENGPEMGGGAAGAACGALGNFELSRVKAIAARLGAPVSEVHRDESAVLLLDCEPVRWSEGGESGLCWSPGRVLGSGIRSWRDAARRGAPGLVVAGTTRGLHSSVSGIEPLYWLAEGGAVYFCTRIDPLVATSTGPLSVDWTAWADVLLLSFPISPRTPFAELQRLEPYSLLSASGGSVRTSVETWPWLEIEPRPTGDGAATVVEELRASTRAIDGRDLVFPLSAGWDSRLLLSLLLQEGRPPERTWTTEPSSGDANEVQIAKEVAERVGLPNAFVDPDAPRYWRHMKRSFELTDYQSQLQGWMVPLADRLRSEPGTLVDGIGGHWIKGRFLTEEMMSAADGGQRITLVWRELARETAAERLLREPLLGALLETAQADFERAAEPFRDHPAGPTFAALRTRTVCGVSHGPLSVLGEGRAVAMPLVADGVIGASIAVPPREKLDGALFRDVLDLVAPEVARLPSTNDPSYRRDNESRRHFDTRRARRGYARLLAESPLRPWFSDALESALVDRRMGRVTGTAKTARLLAGIAMLGLWADHYRDRLRAVDPAELLG